MNPNTLAIDLDGTLLVGERLSERNRLAVGAASDAGFNVVIATARWRQLASRIAAEIGLSGQPVIACSGAQVYSSRQGRDVFDERLPAPFVSRFYDICNANRCIATVTLDDKSLLAMNPKPDDSLLYDGLSWVEAFPTDLAILPRIATLQGRDTIAQVRAMAEADFADEVNIYDSVGPGGHTVVAITHRKADKGTALAKACDYLDTTPAQAIAFGDAGNDLAMFGVAGTSVAMGQAEAEVKAAATHVTAANDEDGVAEFIERELGIKP